MLNRIQQFEIKTEFIETKTHCSADLRAKSQYGGTNTLPSSAGSSS